MKKLTLFGMMAALCVLMASCCGSSAEKTVKAEKYSKKYTNADFYTDGKFNEDVAIEAMKDMISYYDLPFTAFMDANFWVAEFGLGDFENVGMGGIFWLNNKEYGYFAHAIYLLPGQMIPEHSHHPTDMPAKHETWMVEKGWAYNFSLGEPTENAPAIPESHGETFAKHFVTQNVGEIVSLRALEEKHFLMAGPEGAIVSEWATYHDNDGLRFTREGAAL